MNDADLISAAPAAAQPPAGALTRLFHGYEWIARREMLACAVVLILTLGIRAAALPWFPPPLPSSHDEFSYLLAADTFASGRVANPPHPMWQHFETFHELMQPVYASKYPPLQGLILAFGQKFFGQPWAGVFLSAGIMCAAICWMLQGWLPPNLAFLGGLLFLFHVGIFTYWMNSFWGGAAAAIGGALVLGALPRLWRRGQSGHLVTFALGLAILMHSRPWEGAVLGAAALAVLAWMWRGTPALRAQSLHGAIPAAAILLISLGAVAYLDDRITGSPFTMPHALYDKQYVIAPNFAFLPLGPEPVYRHAVIRDLYANWHVGIWHSSHDQPIDAVLAKAFQIYDFFFGFWPLLIPPLLWPYRLKTVEERATVFLLLVFFAVALSPLNGFVVHYAAPIAGLLYVRFLQTLARLHGWRPAGKPLGTAVAVFFVTLFVYQFAMDLSILFHGGGMTVPPFASARNSIAQELAHMPGRQLVLVRYSPGHSPHEEWVWNRADIDGSQTVWARAMDPAKDRELIQYYRSRQPDRRAWMLDADQTPPRLTAYSGMDSQQ
jgi:hypothetical protein